MSERYDQLEDNDRIINSMHLAGKVGPKLSGIVEAVQHQLDTLYLSSLEVVRDSIQVDNANGVDIDQLGFLFGITRFVSETDSELRSRIENMVPNYEAITKDAIVNFFETFTGRKPYIDEPFHTRVYHPGDEVEIDSGGVFNVLFEIPRDVMTERVRVGIDGNSLTVSNTSIVSPATTAISVTTGVTTTTETTIYVQGVSDFNEPGYAKIDNEWVSYESTQTSPPALLSCTRGYWDSVPATHNTDVSVVEGSTLVWLEGTNEQVFASQDGDTIQIEGGSYDQWTWFDVRYQITGVDSDYNISESSSTAEWDAFGARIDRLGSAGMSYMAAGIKCSINVGIVLQNWFQSSNEEIELNEQWDGDVGYGYPMPWYSSSGTQTIIQFNLPSFDEYKVCSTLWDFSHWDHSHWDSETDPVGDFTLKITATAV